MVGASAEPGEPHSLSAFQRKIQHQSDLFDPLELFAGVLSPAVT
jgi:hypothetical protein